MIFTKLQKEEGSLDGLSEQKHIQLLSLLRQYHKNLHAQEIFWRQKSRITWLKDGDANTKFFHRSSILRRRQNRIHHITDHAGNDVCEIDEIRQILFNHFQQRWQSQEVEEINLLPTPMSMVSEAKNNNLIRPVTEEEVTAIVRQMSSDKAPGPNGFQALFFQNFWYIVHKEVVEAVMYVLNQGSMPVGWKRTFIALIPRKINPSNVTDFRSISLCNAIYKVVAKILAN